MVVHRNVRGVLRFLVFYCMSASSFARVSICFGYCFSLHAVALNAVLLCLEEWKPEYSLEQIELVCKDLAPTTPYSSGNC